MRREKENNLALKTNIRTLLKTHMKKALCACTYCKLWASLLISYFLWYSWKLAWPVAFACSTASCITPKKIKINKKLFCHFKGHLKRRTTPISPPAWIMVLHHFLIVFDPKAWIMVLHHFLIIFDPKAGVTRSWGHPRTTASFFKGEHLQRQLSISHKGKPLGSHMVHWKYPVHLDTPTMIGCTGN